ncbi:MAG: PD-(D/E)XK nuclease family protein [Bacilli bacterium]
MNYNTAVNFLKNSMIFQMSLGSKELFHSNVWWWLIENDKNFIKVFIPDFEPAKYHNGEYIRAKREEQNRDILIWLEDDNGNKSHIVIENKIKALPTIEQLKKYTINLRDCLFLKGILTGIGICTLDLTELKGLNGVQGEWSYADYDTISSRIIEIAKTSGSIIIKNHLEQIEEYCNILNCINLILDENINRHKNVLTYECDDVLYDLRIADIFKKHKGSQFINYVKSKKDELEKLKPDGYNLILSQSFHNGKTTLDMRFSNWVNEGSIYTLLGVQIEGDQFRIIAEKNAQLEGISSDIIYETFKNKWFDDSYDKDASRFIFGNETTMKPRKGKKYNKYSTNGYCFIYQYFDVSKIDGRYDSLFKMIKIYLAKASMILKQ